MRHIHIFVSFFFARKKWRDKMPDEKTNDTTSSDSSKVTNHNENTMKNFNDHFGDFYEEKNKNIKPDAEEEGTVAGGHEDSETSDDSDKKKETDTSDSNENSETSDEDKNNEIDEEKEEMKSQLASYEEKFAALEKRLEAAEQKKETKTKEADTENIPRMPTKAEVDADPVAAAEKVFEFKMYQKEQEERKKTAEKEKEDKIKADKEFSRKFWKEQSDLRDITWKSLLDQHPELKDKKSQLFIKANEILEKKKKADSAFKFNPYQDLISVTEAVYTLNQSKKTKKESNLGNGSDIMIPASGTGSAKQGLTEEEFSALPSNEREAYMKQEYMSRGT